MRLKTCKPNTFTLHEDIDTSRERFKDWKLDEKPHGVLITRESGKQFLLPWSSIEWIDYGDAQYVSPTISKSRK